MAFKMKGSSLYKGNGKKNGEKKQDHGMIGMMKARIALENEFGNNPAIKRMIVPPDNPYQFKDGTTGSHLMGSYGDYAIPSIQNVNGKLDETGPRMDEAIRFDRPEDAIYFAEENYKDVAPAFKSPYKKKMGDFKHSDAPDAKGKFKELSAPALASWMIKSRKGNLSKIISSLNQQVVFRRNKDPKYAAKMRRTMEIVRKRLKKDKK